MEELIRLMKRWLHDYDNGHNNDFEHSISFLDTIEAYEREHGEVKMNDWRDES